MNFAVSEESARLVASVRGFVEEDFARWRRKSNPRACSNQTRPARFSPRPRGLGFYAMNMPEEVGGGGLSAVDMCLAARLPGHAHLRQDIGTPPRGGRTGPAASRSGCGAAERKGARAIKRPEGVNSRRKPSTMLG